MQEAIDGVTTDPNNWIERWEDLSAEYRAALEAEDGDAALMPAGLRAQLAAELFDNDITKNMDLNLLLQPLS